MSNKIKPGYTQFSGSVRVWGTLTEIYGILR